MVGYLFGGITSNIPNRSNTIWANDTVYRVYLAHDLNTLVLNERTIVSRYHIFTNPVNDRLTLQNSTASTALATIRDTRGRISHEIAPLPFQDDDVETSRWNAGIYFVE